MRAVGVEEDAIVLGGLLALAPSFGAPLEFEHQVVVAEAVLRGHIAVATPADVKGAVLVKGPDVLGVVMKIGLRIDVMLHVAGLDDFKQVRFLGDRLGQSGCDQQEEWDKVKAHDVNTAEVSVPLRHAHPRCRHD